MVPFTALAVEMVQWVVKRIRQLRFRIENFTIFDKCVNHDTTKHLIRDVPTGWNSMYRMLKIVEVAEKKF